MDTTFDDKLAVMEKKQSRLSHGDSVLGTTTWSQVRNSAVFVTDTLDLAWASAKAIFADKATPEHALAIYDRMIETIESELIDEEAVADDEDEFLN